MRKSSAVKRKCLPDTRYKSEMMGRFINKILRRGKKSIAESIIYSALEKISDRLKKDPYVVFESALKNTSPQIEVRSCRVGGATYQVPVEVRRDRGTYLAMHWIIENAKKRKGAGMDERLASEIIDAANNTGTSVKKREDLHKMAEANKAFAHYRW